MIRPLFLLLLLLATHGVNALANDGVYTGSGSSLMPSHESQISIRKELLTIKRVGMSVHVNVLYEMFNPGREKTATVGFEGSAPIGDVTNAPVKGEHPFIRDFTAVVNGQDVNHEMSYLSHIESAKDDTARKRYTLQEVEDAVANEEDGPFVDYVYTFTARFVPGVNTISHSYVHELSHGAGLGYGYSYILTAANRWANKQIDDFTLILDMGPLERFYVDKKFFSGSTGWKIIGKGSLKQRPSVDVNEDRNQPGKLWITIESGFVEFRAENFHPKGELEITRPSYEGQRFDFSEITDECNGIEEMLMYSLSDEPGLKGLDLTEKQIQIYEALPYARRGMVFTKAFIQRYYERCTDWYVRNTRYKPKQQDLLPEERAWLMRVRSLRK